MNTPEELDELARVAERLPARAWVHPDRRRQAEKVAVAVRPHLPRSAMGLEVRASESVPYSKAVLQNHKGETIIILELE